MRNANKRESFFFITINKYSEYKITIILTVETLSSIYNGPATVWILLTNVYFSVQITV